LLLEVFGDADYCGVCKNFLSHHQPLIKNFKKVLIGKIAGKKESYVRSAATKIQRVTA
jgi:hypothetical protein